MVSTPEIRNRKSEIGNRKSEIRNRKSEIGNRKSESQIGNRKSLIRDHWRDVVGYVMSTHNAFCPAILSCMCGGGRGRDDRVRGLSNRVISSLWGKGAGMGS